MSPDYQYYKPLLEPVAEEFGIPQIVLAAVVQAESSFRADAFRHEPQFWVRYMKKNDLYKDLNPRRYSSSYGLMQPMWVVAVEEGLDPEMPPEVLFQPEQSLYYGAKRLAGCLQWATTYDANEKDTLLSGLAAYNGGRNSSQAPPNPRNVKYALRVWKYMEELSV